MVAFNTNTDSREEELRQIELDSKIRWTDRIPILGPRNYFNRIWQYCFIPLSDDEELKEKYKVIRKNERDLQHSSDTTIGLLIGVGAAIIYQHLTK